MVLLPRSRTYASIHPIFSHVLVVGSLALGDMVLSAGTVSGPGVTPRKLLISGRAGVSVHLGLAPDDPERDDISRLRSEGKNVSHMASYSQVVGQQIRCR